MEIIQIAGLGIVATLLILIIREQKPSFAFMLSLVTGIMIFLLLIGKISELLQVIKNLASQSNINIVFLGTILKIVGIAYICEFAAQLVRDAGEASIASKIELAGKILILYMALPIVSVIIETVLQLLPT